MENIEFHEGDFVQRKDGAIGYIYYVCHCSDCKKRGFFEPVVKYLNGEEDYISIYDASDIPRNYIQIGKYVFDENARSKIKNNCPKYSLIGEITYKDIDPDIISNALLDMKNNNYIPVLKDMYSREKVYWILKKEENY